MFTDAFPTPRTVPATSKHSINVCWILGRWQFTVVFDSFECPLKTGITIEIAKSKTHRLLKQNKMYPKLMDWEPVIAKIIRWCYYL